MAERIQPITMPKWGMTMTEGKISDWLKAPGERVEKGEDFVEVETEKITNVVEAETAGVLRRIVVDRGEAAACGAVIAVLADPDVDDGEIDAYLAEHASAEATAEEPGCALTVSGVDADGTRLGVVTAQARSEDEPARAPAILLHGFGADAAAWMFNQEELAGVRTVHAVEMPSHGASAVDPARADLDAMARCVSAAIDALAEGPVHLVGHSLGGRLAVRLAAQMGERVRSLALIAPAGPGGEPDRSFVESFVTADRRRPMKAALQMLVADPGSISSEMVERTLSYKRTDGVGEALRRIAEEALLGGRAADGWDADVSAATAPILAIWGAEDRILPPSGADALAPRAEVRIIEKAGHMPQMEAAGAVNAALAAHMEASE